jgi:hypothetical protein
MTGQYVGGNPNEAHSGGSTVQAQAQGSRAVETQFRGAAQSGRGAAVEANLPAGYDDYESLYVDRINKIIHLAETAGVNIQAGASALVGTDSDSGAGFSGLVGLLPSINSPR